jgi:hypothetical protein
VLIIGAQKAGTSSLFTYLAEHPSMAPPFRKEVHYFDVNYHRGIRWYEAHFPVVQRGPSAGRRIGFEASPYYLAHPLAPHRIRGLLPGAKFIVLLRDPVARAISHYHHEVANGRESEPLPVALDREWERIAPDLDRLIDEPLHRSELHRRFSYQARGLYADQLAVWFDLFDREQVLILDSGRFFREPAACLARVCEFLEIAKPPTRQYPVVGGRRYPDADGETLERLRAFFRPHNERLWSLLGERFDWP